MKLNHFRTELRKPPEYPERYCTTCGLEGTHGVVATVVVTGDGRMQWFECPKHTGTEDAHGRGRIHEREPIRQWFDKVFDPSYQEDSGLLFEDFLGPFTTKPSITGDKILLLSEQRYGFSSAITSWQSVRHVQTRPNIYGNIFVHLKNDVNATVPIRVRYASGSHSLVAEHKFGGREGSIIEIVSTATSIAEVCLDRSAGVAGDFGVFIGVQERQMCQKLRNLQRCVLDRSHDGDHVTCEGETWENRASEHE